MERIVMGGYLKSPEQLAPDLDENRYTASAMYMTRLGAESSFAATLAWGLKDESDGTKLNGLLVEAEYKLSDSWTAFARAEWEENNELAPKRISRVGGLSLGGIHDWKVSEHWKFGVGALYAFDFTPSSLGYGSEPHGRWLSYA